MKTALLKRLGLATILAGISFVACFARVSTVQAQTQTAALTLSWTDNSHVPNNEDGFNIERGTLPAGPFSALATVGANVVKYADIIPNDPGNRQFCYRVRAFNTAGASAFSNVACGTTPAIVVPPSAPSGMTITITVTIVVP